MEIDNEIVWYENDGLGNFSNINIIASNIEGINTEFAIDIDGDAEIDIISGSSSWESKIYVFVNIGNNSFTTNVTIAATNYIQPIYVADLTGDGLSDILAAANGGAFWYNNYGNGNFGSGKAIGDISNATKSISAIDIDGEPPIRQKIIGGVHGDLGTSSIIVNMIPRVLKSSPGLVTMKDLPPVSAYL